MIASRAPAAAAANCARSAIASALVVSFTFPEYALEIQPSGYRLRLLINQQPEKMPTRHPCRTDTRVVAAWEITDGPVENLDPPDGLDAVTWTWGIERERERRNVTIIMSRTLLAATGHASQDAALARETKGRNYVEAVLDQENPPRYREVNTAQTSPDNLLDRYD